MERPPSPPQPPASPPPAPPQPPGFPQPYAYPQPYGYVQPYGYAPPPRSNRRRWWIFGCGGCAIVALLAVAAVVFVGVRTFTNSPLRQFPTEARASVTSDHFQSTNGQSSETLVVTDPRPIADVEAFYQTSLGTGGWTVDPADPAQAHSGDQWRFGRSGAQSQAGVVTFVTVGATTVVTVEYQY
jgi:hypothetical protein